MKHFKITSDFPQCPYTIGLVQTTVYYLRTSFSNNDLVCECMVNNLTINLSKEIYLKLETIFLVN